jgi:serine/threonine protein kinase
MVPGAFLFGNVHPGFPDMTQRQQVSQYYSRGSLVKYLKGLTDAEAARVDSLRMIHEISKGMAYLHREGVLHGDLKVNVP